MRKYIWIFLVIFCFCPMIVFASEVPEISSAAAILYQLNEDKAIYEKNSHETLAPASLTKIMTVFISLEKIEKKHLASQDEFAIISRSFIE